MTDTVEALDLPFEEAVSFFRNKTNVPTNSWQDVYGAAHSHSFMVAGAATDALVGDFRREIDKALAEGTTLEEFRKGFDQIVEKHGWDYKGERNWRSRIIFETNLRSAYAAGRYAQLTLPETLEAFPYWQYNHSGSAHPRVNHFAWDGLTLSTSDAFWTTNYPPNGWGCGCFVIPTSSADLKRQGKSRADTAPNLVQAGTDVPRGVDPGFEYNPGQRWITGGRLGEAIADDDQLVEFQRRAVEGMLPASTNVPIAQTSTALQTALELPVNSPVRLSVATLRKHLDQRNIGAIDYARSVEQALVGGIRQSPRGKLTGLAEIDGKMYLVGFKRTAYGELLVTTVFRARPAQLRRVNAEPRIDDG